MPTIVKVKEKEVISYETIKAMRNLLQTKRMSWKEDLAAIIYPQTEEQKANDPENNEGAKRVSAIAYNLLRNTRDRMAFLKAGKLMLDQYEKDYLEVSKIVKDLNLEVA